MARWEANVCLSVCITTLFAKSSFAKPWLKSLFNSGWTTFFFLFYFFNVFIVFIDEIRGYFIGF